MSFESIIALVIGVAVIIIATTIIMRMTNNKKKVVRYVKSRCAKQIAVLLNKEKITPEYSFSSEEEDILCSLTIEDWKHWTFQVKDAKEVAKKYPLAFDDFIAESFPQIYNRKCFEKSKFTSTARKREAVIDSMTSEELSLVLAETSDNWNARIKKNSIASEIKRTNRDGYTTYCDVLKRASLSTTEIIRDKRAIIEYQRTYENSKIYEGWEEKQNTFSSLYHSLCSEHRKSDGRFTYQVKFNHIDKFGKLISSEFKVWQGFVDAFSFSDIEEKPPFMIKCTNNLSSFKNKNRFFIDDVYNGIFNLIESVNNKEEDSSLVVFINSSRYNWDKDSYDYHYRVLKSKLSDDGVDFCDIENIIEIDRTSIYSSVIIVDFITNDDDLKSNCRIVAEYFTRNIPCIGYYTLIKEYTEDQIKLHYKKEPKTTAPKPVPKPAPKPARSKEDIEIEYIENLFKKVRKHSYFSAIAIPNTLIGRAGGAERTKSVWLNSPDKYKFSTGEDRNNMITGSYSVDGGLNFTDFNIPGNRDNIHDAAVYSYQLFMRMGIWEQFKSKGEDAISHMNAMGYLSTH